MSDAPEIVTRAEQPCVAIKGQVTMAGLGALAVRTGEVFPWLGSCGLSRDSPIDQRIARSLVV